MLRKFQLFRCPHHLKDDVELIQGVFVVSLNTVTTLNASSPKPNGARVWILALASSCQKWHRVTRLELSARIAQLVVSVIDRAALQKRSVKEITAWALLRLLNKPCFRS